MHKILLPTHRLERLRNSYVHPLQAALAARLPVLGDRVPLRPYWRRRPLSLAAGPEPLQTRALAAATVATALARDAARSAGSASGRMARRPVVALAIGLGAGALSMYYLDTQSGRRRRALVHDRLAHARSVLTRKVPRTVERRGRFITGVAKGLTHEAAGVAGLNGHHQPADDETLVARVRSEVLREREIKAGEINIDAYEGCVTLRGQLEREDDIASLVDAARRVDGVREVRSYLHLPGTLPPNKAESYTLVPPEYARPG
ncbi:MAG TPA: BON domain-containing protein [Dehalococcoidia bacterium]|nr:BON domain-containing protein [Dehalococcoidia bacterium]